MTFTGHKQDLVLASLGVLVFATCCCLLAFHRILKLSYVCVGVHEANLCGVTFVVSRLKCCFADCSSNLC